MNSTLRVIILIIIGLVALAAYGFAFLESNLTLCSPWAIWLFSFIAAIMFAFVTWRFWAMLTRFKNFALNIMVGAAFTTGIFASAFYGANMALPSSAQREKAVVTRKYAKERRRTKRVGRRTYVSGEVYHVYYIDIELASGESLDWQLPIENYNRIRVDDTVSCEVRRGLFGLSTVTPGSLQMPPKKVRRKKAEFGFSSRRRLPIKRDRE